MKIALIVEWLDAWRGGAERGERRREGRGLTHEGRTENTHRRLPCSRREPPGAAVRLRNRPAHRVVAVPVLLGADVVAAGRGELGACRQVSDAGELVDTVSELLSNPDEAARLGRAGQRVLEENRGALERLLVLLEPLLVP